MESKREMQPGPATTLERLHIEAKLKDLKSSAGELEGLLAGIRAITRHLPERASARQLEAIVAVMLAYASGNAMTMTDLIQSFGDGEGNDKAGQSLARTFHSFVKDIEGPLEWFEQWPDRDDRRKKYFGVTPEGTEVIREIKDRAVEARQRFEASKNKAEAEDGR